jgi:hypothetical protein
MHQIVGNLIGHRRDYRDADHRCGSKPPDHAVRRHHSAQLSNTNFVASMHGFWCNLAGPKNPQPPLMIASSGSCGL